MKVITENSLLEMVANLIKSERLEEAALIQRLIDEELEEIDTLTVSKLRPMSDAPNDGTLIEVWHKKSPDPREAYFCDGFYIVDGHDVHENELEGWLQKIIYKPELTGDGG